MARVIRLLARATRGPLIRNMSRAATRLVATAVVMLLACSDSGPVAPSLPAITTTDVASIQQAIALVDSIIADPALASVRTVAIPFTLVGVSDGGSDGGSAPAAATRRPEPPAFGLALRRADRVAQALRRAAEFRNVNLGDFNIPPGFYGGTFVRLGSHFRRDTSLRGAPPNGVRVVLYQRDASGVSTATRSGFMEMIDQNRAGPAFITTARVVASDSVTVSAVSANRHYEPSTGLYNVVDILGGTMGRGPFPPILLIDSLLQFNELTRSSEWEAVTTSLPAAAVSMRVVFPADSISAGNSLRFTIRVGGRKISITGIPFSGSRSYDLTMLIDGTYVANASSANVLTLGDSARTATGAPLPEPLRSYLNSIGALISVAPVAAQVGTSAALLLLILDGTPLP